jgi:hypothetical protein
MSQPTSVTICGQPFAVEWKDLGPDEMGQTFVAHQRIEIDTDLGPDQERDTLLHEICHAIVKLTGHRHTTLTDKQEEAVVGCLAYALLGVLRANPALVAWMTEELP